MENKIADEKETAYTHIAKLNVLVTSKKGETEEELRKRIKGYFSYLGDQLENVEIEELDR